MALSVFSTPPINRIDNIEQITILLLFIKFKHKFYECIILLSAHEFQAV